MKFICRNTLLLIIGSLLSLSTYSQTITPASGGSAISADDFATGNWTTLTGPIIQETTPGQLSSGTFRLRAPNGFVFDTAGTVPTVTVTQPKSNKIDVSFSTRSASEIEFTVTGTSGTSPPNNPHRIEFGNIRTRPSQGIPLATGILTNVGSAAPGGTTSYGTLSMVVGADSRIRVEDAPNSGGNLVSARDIEAGQSITVYANVRDQFNNFKRNESANWSLLNITGGVASGDLSPASGTSATFSANLTGTTQILADLTTPLDSIPSGVINVQPSAPATLSIATQPSASDTAGQVFDTQPVLELLDSFGNIVTTNSITSVSASINTGNDVLQGTTDLSVLNGIASFTDLSYQTAETIDIQFEASGLSPVVSNSVTIVPDTAFTLKFLVQPVNGSRNTPLSTPVEIQLTDQFGNFSSTPNVEVTLNLASGAGNLNGNIDTTNSAGLTTFNNLSFTSNGLKTIQASAVGLQNSPVSDPFTIAQPGKLAGFEIDTTGGGIIGTTRAGELINIRIRAVDGQGSLLDGGGTPARDTFNGFVDLTTNSIFSGSTTVDSVGPFVNGLFDPHPVTLTRSGDAVKITATNSGSTEAGHSDAFQIVPNVANTDSSLITVSQDTVVADGSNNIVVTLNLRDEFGNQLTDDIAQTVSIDLISGTGTLGTTTGNGDGTYSATLTAPSSVGSAVLGATIDGATVTSGNQTVVFTFGELSTFLIESSGGGNIPTQEAGVPFSLRITALDAFDNVVSSFDGTGSSVDITSNGTLSAGSSTTATFTNGVLTAHSVTLTSAGTFSLTARKTASSESGTSNSFTVDPGATDANTTTITSAQSFLQNNGSDNTTITIQLKDQFGNNLTSSPGTVNVSVTGSATVGSPATYINNGQYTTTLTSGTTVETVTISANLNGSLSFTDNVVVTITQFNEWQSSSGGSQTRKVDWERAANWSLGTIPAVGQVVVIPAGLNNYPIIDESDPVLDFLDIRAGATLTLSSRALTVNTELTGGGSLFGNSSTITFNGDVKIANFISGSSNVNLSGGSGGQTIENDFTADSLFIQGDVTIAPDSYLESFSGTVIDPGFTLFVNNNSQFVSLGDILINGELNGTNASFSVGGDITIGAGGNISLTNTSLTLNGDQEQAVSGIETIRSFIIDNNAGVVINNDIVVSDTLFLNDGTLTIESGFSFVSNVKVGNTDNIIARRVVQGNEGWRMLSPPLESDYADLLDSTITQGYTGSTLGNASADSLQPNVLYYDESFQGTDNQRWRAPSNATDALTPGRGLFVYFFGDQSATDPRYDNALPDTLDIRGGEFGGTGSNFTFPVTYTASADTGWNLVGNPFTATLDWDDGNWTKTNMDNVFYVWSDTANAGNGEYLTWNGFTGSLGDGKIAPFQGFWVRANSNGAPVLSVDKAGKTTGGTFYKSNDRGTPTIELVLSVAGLRKTTHLSFSDPASFYKDEYDAYRLTPFERSTYLEFFSLLPDGTQLVINNLPRDFGIPIDIPLYVNGYKNGLPITENFNISWNAQDDVPDTWTVQLLDSEKREIGSLDEDGSFVFKPKQKVLKNSVLKPSLLSGIAQMAQLTTKNKALIQDSDLFLRIIPGDDAAGLPDRFELFQNYPNPFNPETTVSFDLPIQSQVDLTIYDILGRKIKTLVNDELNAGTHRYIWDARNVASGIYIYRLITSQGVFTKKMTLLK